MNSNRSKRKAGALVVAYVCLTVFAIGYFAGGLKGEQAGISRGITSRSLPRKHDVIKVQGAMLGRFDGVPIRNLSLLSLKHGKLEPVPFQIDERNRKGYYVMTGGKSAGHDEDNGKLDANDELIFLVSDAGDRLPEKERFAGGNRIEIEMSDPRYPKQRAWAYLTRYNSNPPRSKVDYVRYDPLKDQIVSKQCTIGYKKGFIFYNDLIYHRAAGGDDKDFLDRIKFRIKVDFFGGKMAFERNEEFVLSKVEGWIDGPVRVIRSTVNNVKLFRHFPPVQFASISEHYPHMTRSPINIKFPFNIRTVTKLLGVRTFRAEVYGDVPGMIGGQAITNLNPEGFTYTGHSTAKDLSKIKRKGLVWGTVTKKGVGTWSPRIVFPDFTYQYMYYYITDDVTLQNPPDDVPGEISGGIIMDILNFPPEYLQWLGTESFVLQLDTYYVKPGASAADVREWLDIQDYPLFIDIHGGEKIARQAPEKKPLATGPPWKAGQDGVITDTRGRRIRLKKIAYFIGTVEADPRNYFLGERVSDETFHKISLSEIRRLSNRYVKDDPVTKTQMAMFSKLTLKDNSTLDLMSCKCCGWAGADDQGQVIYLSNTQVKRIDFGETAQ